MNLEDFIYKVKKDGVVSEDLIKANGGWEYTYDQAQRYDTHPLGEEEDVKSKKYLIEGTDIEIALDTVSQDMKEAIAIDPKKKELIRKLLALDVTRRAIEENPELVDDSVVEAYEAIVYDFDSNFWKAVKRSLRADLVQVANGKGSRYYRDFVDEFTDIDVNSFSDMTKLLKSPKLLKSAWLDFYNTMF